MGAFGGLIGRAVQAVKAKQPAPTPVHDVRTPVAPTRVSADAAKVTTPEAPRRPTGQYVSPKRHPATRHY